MSRFLIVLFQVVAIAAICAGQESPAPNSDPQKPQRLAAGSVIPVELTKTIDAKKAKTGDPVEAKVYADMKTDKGDVILPKDTKVSGRVTEAQARTKEQKESQVAIAFDHATLKNGPEMQMPMSIQAIIAPPSANAGPQSPSEAPSSGNSGGGGMPQGRSPMGGATPQPITPSPQLNPQPKSTMGNAPASSGTQTNGSARPNITANTQGVIGLSNLSLAAAPNAADGSLVTSDKNNVKLESGTLMLLRVAP